MKILFCMVFLLIIPYNTYSQKKEIIYYKGQQFMGYTSLKDVENINPDSVLVLAIKFEKLNDFPKEILKFKNLHFLSLIPAEQSEANKKGLLSKEQKRIYDSLNIVYKYRTWDAPLHKNKIKNVPREISQLKKLEILNIYTVKISKRNVKKLIKYLPNTYIHYPGYEYRQPDLN